jgi:hypothetical protein
MFSWRNPDGMINVKDFFSVFFQNVNNGLEKLSKMGVENDN